MDGTETGWGRPAEPAPRWRALLDRARHSAREPEEREPEDDAEAGQPAPGQPLPTRGRPFNPLDPRQRDQAFPAQQTYPAGQGEPPRRAPAPPPVNPLERRPGRVSLGERLNASESMPLERPGNAGPGQASPGHAAPGHAAPDHAAPGHAGPDRGASGFGGSDRGAPGFGGPDRGAPGFGALGSAASAFGSAGQALPPLDRGSAGQALPPLDRGVAGQGLPAQERGAAGEAGLERPVNPLLDQRRQSRIGEGFQPRPDADSHSFFNPGTGRPAAPQSPSRGAASVGSASVPPAGTPFSSQSFSSPSFAPPSPAQPASAPPFVPPGATPPSAVPPSAVPPSAVPPGTTPPSAVPPSSVPPGPVQRSAPLLNPPGPAPLLNAPGPAQYSAPPMAPPGPVPRSAPPAPVPRSAPPAPAPRSAPPLASSPTSPAGTRIEWRQTRQEAEDRAVATLRRKLGKPRVLAFANPKGGVHKTTATVLAAATIGSVRGRGVLAWDDNELRGTLGLRAGSARHARTIRHLVTDLMQIENMQGNDLMQIFDGYLRHASDGSYDVLAGEENPRFAQRLDQSTVSRVMELLRRTHDVICVDTGNNVESINWQTVMRSADQLVVTTVPREDAAFTADWMLDVLNESGQEELVANAVTLISCPSPGRLPLLDDLAKHFATRTRAVAIVPYDPSLEVGSSIEYGALQPETKQAWQRAAAMMIESFAV